MRKTVSSSLLPAPQLPADCEGCEKENQKVKDSCKKSQQKTPLPGCFSGQKTSGQAGDDVDQIDFQTDLAFSQPEAVEKKGQGCQQQSRQDVGEQRPPHDSLQFRWFHKIPPDCLILLSIYSGDFLNMRTELCLNMRTELCSACTGVKHML